MRLTGPPYNLLWFMALPLGLPFTQGLLNCDDAVLANPLIPLTQPPEFIR